MEPTAQRILAAASGGSNESLYVEDVFSTWLYTGTNATQTITNGLDLATEGGLVWIKARSQAYGHRLVDTVRGAGKSLRTQTNDAQDAGESTGLSAFTSTGFTLGTEINYNNDGSLYASWAFRKAPKFFDVVTYIGTGANRTIEHSLGSVPGCVIVKRTDTTGDWAVYHRSLTNTEILKVNTLDAKISNSTFWNSTTPTSTVFSLGTNVAVNASGGTYVAYLFAHNAGGFGDSGTESIISCGTYTGNNLTTTVELGWEPQWVMIKSSSAASTDWVIFDNLRSIAHIYGASASAPAVFPNKANAEADTANMAVSALPTGMAIGTLSGNLNQLNATYIYIAVRRGPMKRPTDATKVFQPVVYTGTNVDNRLVDTGILTDMVWVRQRNDTVLNGMVVGDRVRGQGYLVSGTSTSETSDPDALDRQLFSLEYGTAFSTMNGFWVGNDTIAKLNVNTTGSNHIALAFRRAPGFFDIVPYTGTGAVRTVSHGLGVVPELIFTKGRSGGDGWTIYYGDNTDYLTHGSLETVDDATIWNDTSPTSSVFTLGTSNDVNRSSATYIAYLFASCPGVSKIGTYTGNGTSQTIDCGFTAGARLVLVKRLDAKVPWYVSDTARGITGGGDPVLPWTANGESSVDWLDPDNSGFVVNQEGTVNANVSGAAYFYLAIA